jgi:hypothetical protein
MVHDQEILNAEVHLYNAICLLLSRYVGMRDDLPELDWTSLERYLADHPERDFAADVRRVVDNTLSDFGFAGPKTA